MSASDLVSIIADSTCPRHDTQRFVSTPAVLHIGYTIMAYQKGQYIFYLRDGNIGQWPGWWTIAEYVPLSQVFEIEPPFSRGNRIHRVQPLTMMLLNKSMT